MANGLNATIGADVIEPAWWADPQIWVIGAILLIIILVIGIYSKVFMESQHMDRARS